MYFDDIANVFRQTALCNTYSKSNLLTDALISCQIKHVYLVPFYTEAVNIKCISDILKKTILVFMKSVQVENKTIKKTAHVSLILTKLKNII